MPSVRSLLLSLGLTLVLELGFSLVWGLRRRQLLLVVLMNLLTNPAVVLLHSLAVHWQGWPPIPVILVLELGAMAVEGLCCRGLIPHPWRFAILVNLFSYTAGLLLQILLSIIF